MKRNIKRREFVSRLSLGLGAGMAQPFDFLTTLFHKSIKTSSKMINPIIKIKPLGFQWETADPFLFCVHHEDHFPKGNEQMGPESPFLKDRHLGDDFIIKDGFRMYHGKIVPGFPGHPHKGFETITVVRKGMVDHSDSMGASGRYGDGDVQWMTAGRGVQHAEMFPLLNKEKENPMELFQIWLNLPRKSKLVEPHFKMMWQDAIPKYNYVDSNSGQTQIEIIAGELNGMRAAAPPPDSWAADPANEVAVWNIKMDPGAEWALPRASKGINRTIYFYEGDSLSLNENPVPKYSAAELLPDQEVNLKAGTDVVRILLLQGKPINEPVIQYGPFVMNTKEEINQAFEEYHKTRFGGWPWPRYDQVHDRVKGRFAIHADGTVEEKG